MENISSLKENFTEYRRQTDLRAQKCLVKFWTNKRNLISLKKLEKRKKTYFQTQKQCAGLIIDSWRNYINQLEQLEKESSLAIKMRDFIQNFKE